MDIINKIDMLLNERKLKNKDIAQYLDLKPQVVTDWRAGRSRSYEKYLPQIASFFDVKIEYLIGEPEESRTVYIEGDIRLNAPGEDELLRKYRGLSTKGKNKAVDYINDLMFNPENVSEQEKYHFPTAAYDGRFTGDKVPYSQADIKKILNSDGVEGEDF